MICGSEVMYGFQSMATWMLGTVAGGEYSVGCTGANFTRIAGTVNKGQSICVRHKTAAAGPRPPTPS